MCEKSRGDHARAWTKNRKSTWQCLFSSGIPNLSTGPIFHNIWALPPVEMTLHLECQFIDVLNNIPFDLLLDNACPSHFWTIVDVSRRWQTKMADPEKLFISRVKLSRDPLLFYFVQKSNKWPKGSNSDTQHAFSLQIIQAID